MRGICGPYGEGIRFAYAIELLYIKLQENSDRSLFYTKFQRFHKQSEN